MNDLEGTINFKNNCKAVSEFKSFSMDSPISEHIFHQGRHFGLLSLSCYKNKLCEPWNDVEASQKIVIKWKNRKLWVIFKNLQGIPLFQAVSG